MAGKSSSNHQEQLLDILKMRFEKNLNRHPNLTWQEVEEKLSKNSAALKSLAYMEDTGGEPDVVAIKSNDKSICFVDCSAESPSGRRSLCYDEAALKARKENKPSGSAQNLAKQNGFRLLNETEYRKLQEFGNFDLKTSSWIETPEAIRKMDGALFCDRRYNHVFTYHNGSQSYYAARGFRGILEL